MKEGRCFICRESGHISRDCPQKNNSASAVTPDEVTNYDESRINAVFDYHYLGPATTKAPAQAAAPAPAA